MSNEGLSHPLLERCSEGVSRKKNPVKMTFEDVRFEVTVKASRKDTLLKKKTSVKQQILKGVSGYAMPG